MVASRLKNSDAVTQGRSSDVTVVDDAEEGKGTLAELESRRQLCVASAPAAYRLEEHVSCICPPDFDHRPALIDVWRENVLRARQLGSGIPFPPQPGTLLSVGALFDRAIEYASRGESVRIFYHPQLGYPVHVMLGEPGSEAGVVYILGTLTAVSEGIIGCSRRSNGEHRELRLLRFRRF